MTTLFDITDVIDEVEMSFGREDYLAHDREAFVIACMDAILSRNTTEPFQRLDILSEYLAPMDELLRVYWRIKHMCNDIDNHIPSFIKPNHLIYYKIKFNTLHVTVAHHSVDNDDFGTLVPYKTYIEETHDNI